MSSLQAPVPPSPNTLEFSRALIATRYLLGARGPTLLEGIESGRAELQRTLERQAHHLSRGLREERARYLAQNVTALAQALRTQRLR